MAKHPKAWVAKRFHEVHEDSGHHIIVRRCPTCGKPHGAYHPLRDGYLQLVENTPNGKHTFQVWLRNQARHWHRGAILYMTIGGKAAQNAHWHAEEPFPQ